MNRDQCVFCGQQVEFIHVHGHYQCPVCKTNALPCCDGDNCDTNALLRKENTGECPEFQYPISNIQYPIS